MSTCSCIKGHFDFYINEIACDKILYKDLSLWMQGDNYIIPKQYDIDILDAGSGEQVKTIQVSGLDVIDISKLFSFKDGIYEIHTSSCDNKYKRWVAILPKLQCCLDRYFASEDYEQDKHEEAQRLLDGARQTALFNQPRESVEFYKLAKKKIDNLNCNC